MEKHTTVSLLSAVMAILAAFDANAGVSLFSDYGQIQNVQKYSSNPFWTPNSPYNQRLPQPVYVQGADLNAGDCIKVVQSKVAVQCMARDNCRNTKLADIRPTIMIELSNLPGNNYVSACSGYIDSVFESYVQQYGSSLPNRGVVFPTATEPNQNLNDNGIQIKNPYQQTTPKWKSEYMERSNELAALQRENGAGTEHLEHNDFPATFNDLSFAARSQFANDDYAIYKDLDTYKGLNALDDEEWCNEHPSSKECLDYMERITNCTDLIKEKATADQKELIVRAEWDNPKSSKRICRVVQCALGHRPHPKTFDHCILNEGTDCTVTDPHALKAKIDEYGECKIVKCEQNWHRNRDETECEPDEGSVCTGQIQQQVQHATRAEYDSDGNCKIKECDGLYTPNQTGTDCVLLPDGSDCTARIEHSVPEVFKATMKNGKCVIESCKNDLIQNSDGTQCIQNPVWYDLRVYSDSGKGYVNTRNDMYCYAVCGVHVDGDDLNEKVLKPNFGGQSFCVPNVKGTSNHESFIMQNSATGEPLKFYDDKLSKIIQGLIQISDTNGCDYWYHDIIAEIWKHDDRDGSVTRVNSHTIDD